MDERQFPTVSGADTKKAGNYITEVTRRLSTDGVAVTARIPVTVTCKCRTPCEFGTFLMPEHMTDMSIDFESLHPRHATGKFAEKAQSEPEIGLSAATAPAAATTAEEQRVLDTVMKRLPEGHPWRDDRDRLHAVSLNALGRGRDGTLTDDDLTDDLAARVRDIAVTADKHDITVNIPGDDNWPSALDDMDNPPAALWTQGDLSLLADSSRVVFMDGARAATAYGEHVAGQLAHDAAEGGGVVMTTGGYGIAAAANRAVNAAGKPSVIFSAGGMDAAYPTANSNLFMRTRERGLVISETPPTLRPTKGRFLRRGEVATTLAGRMVIVEASERSASAGAAGQALRQGKPVGAVPGPVTSAASLGANQLLALGARPVMSYADVEALGR